MLAIHFRGWFQYRLATDPDPTDEPRGASGFTFAVAGEPDFDRTVRFQNPVALRSHCPPVGVDVCAVYEDGVLKAEHPLLGAPVNLLGQPTIESRNQILWEGGQGPINPFHLKIGDGDLTLSREDILYPKDPKEKIHRIPTRYLQRRASYVEFMVDKLKIADATGIADFVSYRRARKRILEEELATTTDPITRAALTTRIEQLSITDPYKNQLKAFSVSAMYQFKINGPGSLHDSDKKIHGELDFSNLWPFTLWMGGWDSDALCGYARGQVEIPIVPMDKSTSTA